MPEKAKKKYPRLLSNSVSIHYRKCCVIVLAYVTALCIASVPARGTLSQERRLALAHVTQATANLPRITTHSLSSYYGSKHAVYSMDKHIACIPTGVRHGEERVSFVCFLPHVHAIHKLNEPL